ncbi:hypothetical protein HY632_02520 [Candidatus Uhrbacteria bacterium]|nr:hypothetical protein [Candidatus Uhrbacteria bacterium]
MHISTADAPTPMWRWIVALLLSGGLGACTTTHRIAVDTQIPTLHHHPLAADITLRCFTCATLTELDAWGFQWEARDRVMRSVVATLAARVGDIATQCAITDITAIHCRMTPAPLTCTVRAMITCPTGNHIHTLPHHGRSR